MEIKYSSKTRFPFGARADNNYLFNNEPTPANLGVGGGVVCVHCIVEIVAKRIIGVITRCDRHVADFGAHRLLVIRELHVNGH